MSFVYSLYEQALEPFIRNLGSSRIGSMAYRPTYSCMLLQVRPQLGQGRMPMSLEGRHHLPTRSRNSRLCLATATNKDMKALVTPA